MKNPFGQVPGYGKPINPLKNGEIAKKLKKRHSEVLRKHMGIQPLSNPCK